MTTALQSLPLMEHFYTIQGEGFYQGKAAYFIRLAGCDVGCVRCDVKESWDASGYPVIPVEELALTDAIHAKAQHKIGGQIEIII
jgi:organic radical activating enzyme